MHAMRLEQFEHYQARVVTWLARVRAVQLFSGVDLRPFACAECGTDTAAQCLPLAGGSAVSSSYRAYPHAH